MSDETMKFVISNLKYTDDLDGIESVQSLYARILLRQGSAERSVVFKNFLEPIICDGLISDTMIIQIYRKHRVRRDNFKGETSPEVVGELLEEGLVTRKVFKHGSAQEPSHSVYFEIALAHAPGGILSLTTQALRPNHQMAAPTELHTEAASPPPPVAIKALELAFDSIESAPWVPLLAKAERINRLMVGISEVHPYAKTAWGVLSAVAQFLIDQMNRDEHVKQLILLLDDVFNFFNESFELEHLLRLTSSEAGLLSQGQENRQIRILVQIFQQIMECAYFICDYVQDTSYWKRMIKHAVSDVDDKIQNYQVIFAKLKSAFQDHAIPHTQIAVLQIKILSLSVIDKLDDIAMKLTINEIPHVTEARYNPDKGCIPNTRTEIIDEIIDWANKPVGITTGAQIFWLTGVAGSGKSAIAHTVAQRFQAMNRLGSSFCFSLDSQATRAPHNLFSTIAWELGTSDIVWRHALWNILQTNPSLQFSYSVTEQFESMLLKASKSVKMTGPTVIVIDALDECGDATSRKSLLSVLAKRLAELPSNFHIVITSRPESDILKALKPCMHITCKQMEDIGIVSTNRDLFQFIQSSVSVENRLLLNEHWQGDSWCQLLIERAEGLFQWAFTACLFTESDFYTVTEQVNVLLQSTARPFSPNLDFLYIQILDQKTSGGDPGKIGRFVSIMSTILALKKPLSISALAKFCSGKDMATVKSILQPLGSLLNGVSSESTPVQTLHTSLHDFLRDKSRSGKLYTDTIPEHYNIASVCLEIMMKELHFNMCQLPSSHQRNEDIADLESRIQKNVPAHLSYACFFWADHLEHVSFEDGLCNIVTEFLNSKLLYWLEILSLTKSVNIALTSLNQVSGWLKNHNPQLAVLARDAHNFVATFWVVITESAPHVYLSALPFSPKCSIVAKQYTQQFANTLILSTGQKEHWPGVQNILVGHQGPITSISLSPDGKYLASGSYGKTIYVQDFHTGSVVTGPIKGHKSWVSSVAFSYDGKFIASGSGDNTVCLWDAQTGNPVADPFYGHTDCVLSVAFSPNGCYVASGSVDKKVRRWDIKTKSAGIIFEGHTNHVNSVAFSPDGQFIASAADDKTIRLWDAISGGIVGMPFEGHTSTVQCIAFSSDGTQLVSGSLDSTTRIWNIQTRQMVFQPMEGSAYVISVAFSPDSKYVASGSHDGIVRLWNTETGQATGDPLEGHLDVIMTVLFSPDGKQLISASHDSTIRVWDLKLDDLNQPSPNALQGVGTATTAKAFDGHTRTVTSISISPDSKLIVSGSEDKTVKMWNTDTGMLVSKPFMGHSSAVMAVSFSPNGKFIASGSDDMTIKVWDAQTGNLIGTPFTGNGAMTTVVWSPNNEMIASGSSDKIVYLWNTRNHTSISYKGHTQEVNSVAYSPDGNYIASGSDDQTIILWDVYTTNSAGRVFTGHTGWVNSVTFSPNGKYIVSCSTDKTIILWDVSSGQAVQGPLRGHTSGVNSVAFSPNGKFVISSSDDKTIRVWDFHTGQAISIPLWGHANMVSSAVFSPDMRFIVSGSDDSAIRIWVLETILSSSKSSNAIQCHHIRVPPFRSTFSIVERWVLGPDQELLFWLPPWCSDIAFPPQNPAVISKNQVTLDYSNFVHGKAWVECKTSL